MKRTRDAKPIPVETLMAAAAALRVLAHPHRLRIVELLEGADLTVGELAEQMGIAHAACSQHLSLMRANGLLTSRREGKVVYYKVNHPSAVSMLQCIRANLMD